MENPFDLLCTTTIRLRSTRIRDFPRGEPTWRQRPAASRPFVRNYKRNTMECIKVCVWTRLQRAMRAMPERYQISRAQRWYAAPMPTRWWSTMAMRIRQTRTSICQIDIVPPLASSLRPKVPRVRYTAALLADLLADDRRRLLFACRSFRNKKTSKRTVLQ